MSLQVWLPLTGHLNNQGLSNVTVTNNGATVDNNGKIGKCYYLSGTSTSYIDTGYKTALGTSDFTISLWLKLPTITSGSYFAICTSKTSGAASVGCGIYWNYTQKKFLWSTADGSGATEIFMATAVDNIVYDKWIHLVMVRNSSDSKLGYFYINGTRYELASVPTMRNIATGTNMLLGKVSNNNYYVKGYYNDFRIYNHALSAKEIKELAKGLVLHYPLSAGFGGAENLFRDSYFRADMILGAGSDTSTTLGYYNGATSNHSLANGEDTITLNSSSNIGINFKRLATDINLDTSSYYTISCEAKCTNANAHLDIGLSYCNTSNTWIWRGGTNPQNFTAANTWQKFTLTFKPDANTKYIGYCFTCNCGGNHTLVLRHCKLEKGSVATPWTMNSGDVELADIATTEYDVSGYNNHGTKLHTITYDSDTARYNVSSYFNGTDAGILIENLYISNIINTAVTYSFWIKPNGENGARSVYFGSYSGTSWSVEKNAANALRLYWNGSPDEICTGATIADDVWQHICITKQGTNDIKVYINGVQKWSSTATHNNLSFPTTYRIGRDTRSGDGTPYKGLISDFRIYATALSAEDVKQLYNTAAALCNNGTLMAYSFNES